MNLTPFWSGWLYLAVPIDLCSRMVVGWAMSDRDDEPLVSAALRMAITHRRPQAGLIHHTDRGELYSAGKYRRLMADHGLLPKHESLWRLLRQCV